MVNRRTVSILVLLISSQVLCLWGLNVWRYETLRSIGPLDLAYFNHQLYSLWDSAPAMTIQPEIAYGHAGPEPWRSLRFRPITFLLALPYVLFPGIPYLEGIQSLWFGLGAIGIYRIVYRGCESQSIATIGAALYLISPGIWLLGTSDFRYLFLGLPALIWFYDALDARSSKRVACWFVVCMTIREPLWLVIVLLTLLRLLRWSQFRENMNWIVTLTIASLGWFCLSICYMWVFFGDEAAWGYIDAMRHPNAYYGNNPGQELELLKSQSASTVRVAGPAVLSGWTAPEFMISGIILGYPPLKMGLFAVHPAKDENRFMMPAIALFAIGGAVSLARFARWYRSRPSLVGLLSCFLLVTCAATIHQSLELLNLPHRLDPKMSESDVRELGILIKSVPPADGVFAFEAVLPNLSSRSTIFDVNQLPAHVGIGQAIARSDWFFVDPRQFGLIDSLNSDPSIELHAEFAGVTVFHRQ